jgi:hypothetical protein
MRVNDIYKGNEAPPKSSPKGEDFKRMPCQLKVSPFRERFRAGLRLPHANILEVYANKAGCNKKNYLYDCDRLWAHCA